MKLNSIPSSLILCILPFIQFTAAQVATNATTDIPRKEMPAVSGIGMWVDVDTPEDKLEIKSSRGDTWKLVMSDEFNSIYRNFTPGNDPIWTSLDKPDGVNGALGYYGHDMAYVECKDDLCYLNLKMIEETKTHTLWNEYTRPPQNMNATFFYRSAMLQTWNKFCFQGGLLEVRAQLPSATSEKSLNPDVPNGINGRASSGKYYPTWPGIWLLGNLGRAIFSGSTQRMWPFSYDECNPAAFDPENQRISACNGNPGHGLNPYQGRGAPEIDLLEGGGVAISSSIQIGPGMNDDFRLIYPDSKIDKNRMCAYYGGCGTIGANLPNVPTTIYKKRGYDSWYKGLRYAYNPFCAVSETNLQTFEMIDESINRGIIDNICSPQTCPSSNDVLSSLDIIDGKDDPNKRNGTRWGINDHGHCSAVMNAYNGGYLCDPDNQDPHCPQPRKDSTPKTNVMKPFNYQMDAISANWDIHMEAYLDFVIYSVEWVMGDYGYIRWMVNGAVVFEIPGESITFNIPQDENNSNPRRIMIEEPMYIILNIAISASWGAQPSNPGHPCRGEGLDYNVNRICDEYPMHMKIDYVRVYQDPNSNMSVGCDPKSHPTRQYILDNVDLYTDYKNELIEVVGGASCQDDSDCQASVTGIKIRSGKCNMKKKQCECTDVNFWAGPRCTTTITTPEGLSMFGPSTIYISIFLIVLVILFMLVVCRVLCRRRNRHAPVRSSGMIQRRTIKNTARKDFDITRTRLSTRLSFSQEDEEGYGEPLDDHYIRLDRIKSTRPSSDSDPSILNTLWKMKN